MPAELRLPGFIESGGAVFVRVDLRPRLVARLECGPSARVDEAELVQLREGRMLTALHTLRLRRGVMR